MGLMNIFKSTVSGFAAGGPWGAAVGAGLGIGASIWGAKKQGSAASSAGAVMSNASNAAADAAAMEGERGSADVRNTSNAAATSLEEAGNNAFTNIQGVGNRVGNQILEAGSQGRQSILDSLKGLDPYSDAGKSALDRITQGLGEGGEFSKKFEFDPNLMNDAGMKFRIAQGTAALQNSAAGKGMIGGNLAKGIIEHSQGVASEEYDNAFNRSHKSYTTNRAAMLDPLQALVGVGERANNSRISGTTAAEGLNLDATTSAGNAFRDSSVDASAAQMRGVEGAGEFRTRGDMEAARLRADATRNAGLFRQDGASATAAGKVGSANAFASGLSGTVNGVNSINWGSLRKPPVRDTRIGGAYGGG